MRKNSPGIQWRVSQGAGNMQNKRLSGWTLAFYILYAAALSMLSLYAACLMGDQFGLPMEERWPVGLWWAAGWSLVVVTWNELIYAWRKRVLRLTGDVVLFLVAYWGPDGWFFFHEMDKQKMLNGMYGVGQRYLEIWNHYFSTSHEPSHTVTSPLSEQQCAWVVFLVLLAVLLQVFSGFLRKRVVMLLLPAAVLAAGMLVGVTPRWPGLACMFAAGLLSLHLDCNREFRAAAALALAGILAAALPLTARVMEGPAAQVNQLHDGLQAFQHQVEREIRDYDWQALFSPRQDGRVDNHKPEYTKEEVLTITVNKLPDANMYLRGYYGTDYQRGRWDAAEKTFDRACRRQGVDSGEAARLLAGLSSPAQSAARMRYELQYTGLRSGLAYLPYGADLETVQEQYQTSGDYVVEKSNGQERLVFTGYAPGRLVRNDREERDSDAQKFYLWYNEYVTEQYLVVSEDLPILTDIVNSIESSNACQIILERSQVDADGRNAARLALGSLVAGELRSLARYNIDPGPLPGGTDPVEYFLGENRQGYCVHFASAGALILRQLGVPARFVSGYVVRPDRFRQSPEGYHASVRDDDAHAWVEVWLEDVGWVPVEMTPGYESTEIVLAGQDQQPVPISTKEPDQTPAENAGQDAEIPPVPTAEPQDQLQESSAEPDTEMSGQALTAYSPGALIGPEGQGDPEGQDDPKGWGFAGEGGWAAFGQNGSLRVSYVVLALLGIVAAAMGWLTISWLHHRRNIWWQVIQSEIERGGTRKAVKILNRRLYKRLRRKRAGILLPTSDEEYLAALRRQYPQEDWDSYLAVVRKAVYSRENIGVEEAKACYALLRRTG